MFLELLYSALASPFGIEVETNSVERLRQKLYAMRRQAADPALEVLALVAAPNGHLWIVRKPELAQ